MTLVEGDDMQRLWALVVDLSSQLNMNRQQITSLQTQLQNLKAHSVHTNTGFALRRFNVDVAKETFESELERLNVHLAQENNDLRWENKMNERLIKEYEQCLDLVMKKFRAFSHATQTHTLKLTQYYEDLLASNTHDVAAVSLHAQTSLSSTLSNLGTLVRNALREVEGEAPSPPPSMLFHDDGVGEEDAVPGEGSSASASSSSRKRQQSHQQQAHLWPGSGGYTGKAGDAAAQRSDAALEREAELQMLRYENETLKEILDMAEGKGLDVGAGKDKLSLGTPRGGGSVGSASGHGGGGAGGGAQRKVRTPSMHQQPLPPQQQQQQPQLPGIGINQLYPPPPAAGQQQQQQQPAYSPMAPRSTPQDIPAAPFPSSSISAPLSHPVPPPTPPSTGGGTGGGVGRIPLHERMQQAADAIRSQGQQQQAQQHAVTLHASSADESTTTAAGAAAAAPSGSSAAPYLIPERASSTTATSQPSIPALSSFSSSSSTSIPDFGDAAAAAAASGDAPPPPPASLVPTPSESGSAQSDIRGAAMLPLVETNTTTPATVAGPAAEESTELQKEAEREAGEDLPVVEPEVEAIKQHREAGEAGEVERAAVAALLDVEKAAPGEVESEPPAEHDVDLSDAAEDEKETSLAATHEATIEDDNDAQPEEEANTTEAVPAVLPSAEGGSTAAEEDGEAAGGEEAAMTAAMEPAAVAEATSSGGDEADGAEEGQSS